jgi:hypothetical protein
MSKMDSYDPFAYLNTSYGQKKGWDSNCQFDSRPLKVKNRPDLLMCRWHAIYRWKFFDEGYNFVFDVNSIEDLHNKLWASKVATILISKFPTWESWDKMTFGCWPRGKAQRIL